MKKVEGHI